MPPQECQWPGCDRAQRLQEAKVRLKSGDYVTVRLCHRHRREAAEREKEWGMDE